MDAETSGPRDPNHIWLRQSVTFSVNGQTRTVEMALPLRPGATPDEVEALLDEADAGMRRLSRRLDSHIAALLSPVAPGAIHDAAVTPTAPAFSAEPEMNRQQFIGEISAIGLTSRQAMERLGVKSLDGLNLREALATLQRQRLLEGVATPAEIPAPRPPLAFEEEEGAEAASEPDMELSYLNPASLPGDEEEDLEEFVGPPPPAAEPERAPSLEELRRDARLTSAAKLQPPAPRRPSPPPEEPETVAPTPAPPEPEETPAERAARTLSELRALNGGGTPSDHQRAALKNVVVSELSERGVDALTRAVWDSAPDEMGPEQYDALISWGKRDHFKDEAREVLKIARVTPMAPAETPAPEKSAEPTPPARSGRGGSRARSATSAESEGSDETRGRR